MGDQRTAALVGWAGVTEAALAVHRALGLLRLQGFTGVLWVDGGACWAEGVSDLTAPARLWDARYNATVAAVRALGPGRVRVDVRAGCPVRQGAAWATLDRGPRSLLE